MSALVEDRPTTDLPDQGEVVDESTPLSRFLEKGGTSGVPASPGYLAVATQFAEIIGIGEITDAAIEEHVRRMEEEKLAWGQQLRKTLRAERNPRLQEVLRPHYGPRVPERIRERITHGWMDVIGPAVCQAALDNPQAEPPAQVAV